jgi:hypothetical protein
MLNFNYEADDGGGYVFLFAMAPPGKTDMTIGRR